MAKIERPPEVPGVVPKSPAPGTGLVGEVR